MQKRNIGRSNIAVMPLCFGGNVFGWTADESTSFKLLDGFVDAGFDFIDTADVYSRFAPGNQGGESETVIGNWLKRTGKRSQVVIATKLGMDMGDGKKGLSKKYMRQAVDRSLERLQTDYIDLYQAHVDDEETPLEETLESFAELIKQGKVRSIGASNYSAARLKKALEISAKNNLPRYECLQPLYNLYDREDFEKKLQPVCREHEVGVISYFSLAAGFLTGKYRSEEDLGKSVRGERTVAKYLNERGMRILAALDKVAKDHGSAPATVAIAWLTAKPTITAPIASATKMHHLSDLVAATKLRLDPAAMEELDRASAY